MLRFCEECHELVNYTENSEHKSKSIKGKEINYIRKEAYCNQCESLIFVPEIHDYNLSEIDKKYREVEGLIQIEEIDEILSKYNIGVRPMSLILGWGEGTLTRYKSGDIPTKQYSDKLKEILSDYTHMDNLLEENIGLISEIAYKKCREAINKQIDLSRDSVITEDKIDDVIKYLLNKCVDVTPLSLQKLLYYAQSFNKVFFREFLFSNDCEAWVHGPVYRKIYNKYSSFGYNTIEEDTDEFTDINLSDSETQLLDSIVDNLGCYSGKVLEKMTHTETPWLKTREGLGENIACNRIIEKDLIEEYFEKIRCKYNMINPSDIKDYSIDIFQKINV